LCITGTFAFTLSPLICNVGVKELEKFLQGDFIVLLLVISIACVGEPLKTPAFFSLDLVDDYVRHPM